MKPLIGWGSKKVAVKQDLSESESVSEFRLETRKRGTRSELGLGHEKNCYLTLNQARKTEKG